MAVKYTQSLENIDENNLSGFFVNWPNPPSSALHLKLLQGSYCFWLAVDEQSGQVVGFINTISDGVLSSYIPLPRYCLNIGARV